MEPGDVADVIGPLPVPWLTRKRCPGGAQHIALVIFGVAVTELVSLLRSELLSPVTMGVTVLWCLRTREELAIGRGLLDEFNECGERVRITHAFSRSEPRRRAGPQLMEEIFGHLDRGTTAVVAVGRKRAERECYGWFRGMGFRRRLMRMGVRCGRRERSPLWTSVEYGIVGTEAVSTLETSKA